MCMIYMIKCNVLWCHHREFMNVIQLPEWWFWDRYISKQNTYLILPDIHLQNSQIWVSSHRGPNKKYLLLKSSQSSNDLLYDYIMNLIDSLSISCINVVMVNEFISSAIEHGSGNRFGQTKDYAMDICCFSKK